MTVTCICAVGYQIFERVMFFRSRPVNINVEINYNKTLKFPAVTICNQNAFKATKAAEFGFYELIEDAFSKSAMLSPEDFQRYNTSNITIQDVFVKLGHDRHDLFVSCRWRNTECGPEDFIPVLTDHGLCYTFSPNSSGMVISAPGIDSGLQLMLNIEQYEYMNGPHDSAGVKVLLHDPDQTPLVASLGQAVSTGVSAYAGINLLMIEYQEPPYGDCGSKPLNHTKFYTAEECFLDCLTEVVTEKCGCRDMYMKTNGSNDTMICNLLQYLTCIKDAKDEFYGMFEKRCKCPVACKVTIFDPTFSDGTLSNHAVDSLLSSNLSISLYWKLLEALEVKAKMDKRKQDELRGLLKPLNKAYSNLLIYMYLFKEYLRDYSIELRDAVYDFADIYQFPEWIQTYQLYVFSVGILQGKDSVSNYLSESANEFLYALKQRLEYLRDMTDTQDMQREVVFNQTIKDLQFRQYLIKHAQDDINSLLQSFTEGVISHDTLFSKLNQTNTNLFVPIAEMKAALLHKSADRPVSDTLTYCKDEIIHLYANISAVADLLIDITESTFRNSDNTSLSSLSTDMLTEYVDATDIAKTCWDILNNMVFQKTKRSLEAKRENSISQREEFLDIYHMIYQLESHLEDIVESNIRNMRQLKRFVDMAQELVELKQHSMSELYSLFVSENIQLFTNMLKEFSFEFDTREQLLRVYFKDLMVAASAVNISMRETGYQYHLLLDEYNRLMFNPQNPQGLKSWGYYYDTLYYLTMTDLGVRSELRMKDIDHDFINAFENLVKYVDNFNKSVRIDGVFFKENFLKLDVFYRQLSYEFIQQQKGYDEYALICDIGGSLGLFIGASMLTAVEVIDLILGQTPVFRKKKNNDYKDDSSKTSDTNADCSS